MGRMAEMQRKLLEVSPLHPLPLAPLASHQLTLDPTPRLAANDGSRSHGRPADQRRLVGP